MRSVNPQCLAKQHGHLVTCAVSIIGGRGFNMSQNLVLIGAATSLGQPKVVRTGTFMVALEGSQ